MSDSPKEPSEALQAGALMAAATLSQRDVRRFKQILDGPLADDVWIAHARTAFRVA